MTLQDMLRDDADAEDDNDDDNDDDAEVDDEDDAEVDDGYEEMTVKTLRQLAKGKGLTGYSRLRRDDLIELLHRNR
eukprot:377626-Heterocapsa_arctica.AAC.1